jgi:hypothetical protein
VKELNKGQLGDMVQSCYWDAQVQLDCCVIASLLSIFHVSYIFKGRCTGWQGEEKLLLEAPLETPLAAIRLSFFWNDQAPHPIPSQAAVQPMSSSLPPRTHIPITSDSARHVFYPGCQQLHTVGEGGPRPEGVGGIFPKNTCL